MTYVYTVGFYDPAAVCNACYLDLNNSGQESEHMGSERNKHKINLA